MIRYPLNFAKSPISQLPPYNNTAKKALILQEKVKRLMNHFFTEDPKLSAAKKTMKKLPKPKEILELLKVSLEAERISALFPRFKH